MIKNYNQFINEGLLDYLKGPSKEDLKNILEMEPTKMLITSAKNGYLDGVKKHCHNQ